MTNNLTTNLARDLVSIRTTTSTILLGSILGFGAIGSDAAYAITFTYSGSTTPTSPVFRRPLEGDPPTGLGGSFLNSNFSYDAFLFNVDISGNYDFLSTASGFNNFTVLYENAFTSNALTNALVANNDLGGTTLSGFNSRFLNAGTNYIFVTTSSVNGTANTGSFTNTITGPGNVLAGAVTSVPEPFTIIGTIIGGTVAVRMRKKLADAKKS